MKQFIEINLLPVEDRKIKKDYSYLLDIKVVLPTVSLIVIFALTNIMSSINKNKFEEQREVLAKLDEDINNRIIISNNIKKLDEILKEKQAKNNSLKSISFNKQLWVRILEGANKALPVNSWLMSITQNAAMDSSLQLKGSTFLFSEVAQYMIELGKNDFFTQISLESVEVDPIRNNDAFNFTLNISLNLSLGANNPVNPRGKLES